MKRLAAYVAASSSDGSGAGPSMVGTATPVAGTFDGMVWVLVTPTVIFDVAMELASARSPIATPSAFLVAQLPPRRGHR